MNTQSIPTDLLTIAAARGFKLTQKEATFVVRDGRATRFQTRDLGKLRAWLSGVESVMVRKGA